jgi:APA family basic amino acid/polyamine antiporter
MPDVGGQLAYLRGAFHPIAGFLHGWVLLLVIQGNGGRDRYVRAIPARTDELVGIGTGRRGRDYRGVNDRQLSWRPRWQPVAERPDGSEDRGDCSSSAGGNLIRSPYPLQHPVLDRAPSIYLVTSIGVVMVPVLFAFGGWQTANFIAAEIKAHSAICLARWWWEWLA